MTKFLLGCVALMIGVCAVAQSFQGIAYGSGEVLNNRGKKVDTDFWVASTPAGVYGRFWYKDRQQSGISDNVEIRINRFIEFGCADFTVVFYGHGYVNGTPRLVVVQAQDNVWYSDLFAIAAFHPISGTLIYDRYGMFTRGGVTVLCELPGGGEG